MSLVASFHSTSPCIFKIDVLIVKWYVWHTVIKCFAVTCAFLSMFKTCINRQLAPPHVYLQKLLTCCAPSPPTVDLSYSSDYLVFSIFSIIFSLSVVLRFNVCVWVLNAHTKTQFELVTLILVIHCFFTIAHSNVQLARSHDLGALP